MKIGNPSSIGILKQFDADASRFIDAAGITNLAQQGAVLEFVEDLKTFFSGALWDSMIAIYPMIGGNATAHSYNLKNPDAYQLTFAGGWTHSSTGALPNGTNAFAYNTGLIPSSIYSAANNQGISYYSRTSTAKANEFVAGCSTSALTTNTHGLVIRNTQNRGYYYADGTGNGYRSGYYSNSTNGQGLRTGAQGGTTSTFYLHINNGTPSLIKSGSATAWNTNVSMIIGALNGNGNPLNPVYYTDKECAFVAFHGYIAPTEVAAYFSAVQNYQTLLSRNV